MEKTPLAPATLVCATKVAALSTSVIVSVPPVLSAALVSDSVTAALEMTAALFEPLIVTCTVLVVPSADATVKLSDTDWPTLRLTKLLLAEEGRGATAASDNGPLFPAKFFSATKG